MKKFIAGVVLGLSITSGLAFARDIVGCESLDVNHDQQITATDALIVLRASVGLDGCN